MASDGREESTDATASSPSEPTLVNYAVGRAFFRTRQTHKVFYRGVDGLFTVRIIPE